MKILSGGTRWACARRFDVGFLAVDSLRPSRPDLAFRIRASRASFRPRRTTTERWDRRQRGCCRPLVSRHVGTPQGSERAGESDDDCEERPREGNGSLLENAARCTALGMLVASMAWTHLAMPSSAEDALTTSISSDNPVFDAAKVLPTQSRHQLNDRLKDFEERTGWRIRLLTSYQGEAETDEDEIRAVWKPNHQSVIMAVDPSSPNIIAFRFVGSDAQQKLRRQFWIELQTRFGNMFYVRQEGEDTAIKNVVKALEDCLQKPEGCAVVPGLPMDHFYFTLALSIAGGLVFGFASKLESNGGFAQPQWVWVLMFSPLWFILFVSLGLGPVISRTTDVWPVAADSAGFLGAIFLFRLLPNFPPREPESSSGGDFS